MFLQFFSPEQRYGSFLEAWTKLNNIILIVFKSTHVRVKDVVLFALVEYLHGDLDQVVLSEVQLQDGVSHSLKYKLHASRV